MLGLETEAKEAEIATLRALLEDRARGEFISMEESDRQIDAWTNRKRTRLRGAR